MIKFRFISAFLILAFAVSALPVTKTKVEAAADSSRSPLGYVLNGNTVNMISGQNGTTKDGNTVTSRWALDDTGRFVISIEAPGEYSFRFTNLDTFINGNSTFDVTVIGAGGGGGGATVYPNAAGQGGSGGDIVTSRGNYITSYTAGTTVKVGAGGAGGQYFLVCTCGGDKCPIGNSGSFSYSTSQREQTGRPGESSSFGSISAAGGSGGLGGHTRGERYSKTKAASGNNGISAGTYMFWGACYNCGIGGGGGEFGGNNGSTGNPAIFHEGNNSFGKNGVTAAGKGNGGSGSGFSFTYGHPQYSGTGTGVGMGSYSVTMSGTAATGGTSSTNGYVYIEGQITLPEPEESEENPENAPRKAIDHYQLRARLFPDATNTMPNIVWATTNPSVAKVSQTGLVSIYGDGKATITATADTGAQGYYEINVAGTSKEIKETTVYVYPSGSLSRAGDIASMVASVYPAPENDFVAWSSTNIGVVTVGLTSGIARVVGPGTAKITATLPDGTQGTYLVTVSDGLHEAGDVPITALSIYADRHIVAVGSSTVMTVNPYPVQTFTGTWESTDASVATVNDIGEVIFLKEGTATILATASSGVSAAWTFTVTSGINMTELGTDIESGGRYTVKAGDSIFELADNAYGNADYWQYIVAINNRKVSTGSVYSVIPKSRVLVEGQLIYIPSLSEIQAERNSAEETEK